MSTDRRQERSVEVTRKKTSLLKGLEEQNIPVVSLS